MTLRNIEKLRYTFCHRQAFLFVLDTVFKDSPLYEELSYRAAIHDRDKALYLTIGDRTDASACHRATNPHHMENGIEKSEADLIEAVIDYECAGYTKPDKPLNAYDTIMAYRPAHSDEMLEVLSEYGIDRSYDNTPQDPDWIEWQRRNWVEPTDEVIERVIAWFKEAEPEWAAEVRQAAEESSSLA